jgi:DUF2917 family protein
MACFQSGTVISLATREAITLRDVRGATVRIAQGTLWLTQERDRHDVVLRPGDNWVVESNGNTVVEAQNDATFTIVGRGGKLLKLPNPDRSNAGSSSIWSTLAGWLDAPPGHRAPYA